MSNQNGKIIDFHYTYFARNETEDPSNNAVNTRQGSMVVALMPADKRNVRAPEFVGSAEK